MNTTKLINLVRKIVESSAKLHLKHTGDDKPVVNYVCIFSQSESEFNKLSELASNIGKIILETTMGPVFRTKPIETVAGKVQIVKIRRPDPRRQELGDADFTVENFEDFKKTYLQKDGWSLITRPEMDMLELIDPEFDTLAYYSHPTLAYILKINLNK